MEVELYWLPKVHRSVDWSNQMKISHNQISPFDNYQQEMGRFYLQIHKALNLLEATWTQLPHWDHEPSQEELDAEMEHLDRAERAKIELEEAAEDIYIWLAGKLPPSKEEIEAKRSKSMDDVLRENGWLAHCYSPLEISKSDGSFASKEAADIVVEYLREASK